MKPWHWGVIPGGSNAWPRMSSISPRPPVPGVEPALGTTSRWAMAGHGPLAGYTATARLHEALLGPSLGLSLGPPRGACPQNAHRGLIWGPRPAKNETDRIPLTRRQVGGFMYCILVASRRPPTPILLFSSFFLRFRPNFGIFPKVFSPKNRKTKSVIFYKTCNLVINHHFL